MKHLWEVKHDYYCNEGNYTRESVESYFQTWQEFMYEFGDCNMDFNLLFRFDWTEESDEDETSTYTGDDYYRNGKLKLFWMGQRKGLYQYSVVEVCRADEPAVIEFLKPRYLHLMKLWEPLCAVDGETIMEYFVTKEQVKQVLEHHGHHIVMDSAFITGAPMSELEAIVDVCDVVAKAAYDQGVKDSTERHIDLQNQMAQRVEELQQFNQDLRVENKELSETVEDLREANRGLADSVVKKSEAQELEKSIETIQATLSDSFRDNLKLEVTEQHAWLVYDNLKFLIEPMEAWQVVQSCVYLSGLEVEND